jgi:hypothetical protein
MHKRLLPHLLLSLTLLSAACKKEKNEPEPEPASMLEGRWTEQNRIFYDMDPLTGQQMQERIYPPEPHNWQFTRDSIIVTSRFDTRLRWPTTFTRRGDTLRYDRTRARILELTDHKLVLRFIPQRTFDPYTNLESAVILSR